MFLSEIAPENSSNVVDISAAQLAGRTRNLPEFKIVDPLHHQNSALFLSGGDSSQVSTYC